MGLKRAFARELLVALKDAIDIFEVYETAGSYDSPYRTGAVTFTLHATEAKLILDSVPKVINVQSGQGIGWVGFGENVGDEYVRFDGNPGSSGDLNYTIPGTYSINSAVIKMNNDTDNFT